MRLLVPCSALILLLAGCSNTAKNSPVEASSKAAEPLAVETRTVETRRIDRTISVTGSLHPDESVSLGAEVAGRISKIHFDFGQSVRKGDVVAELDQREYLLQRDRSRSALSQALARVGLDPNQVDVIPENTPAIRQAQAQYEDALSKYKSAQKLVASGDISRERFTEVEKGYVARQAAMEATRDDLRTQLASIQALRAELKLVEKRLEDTVLRAPFSGSVAARLVSPGQFLKENTPIVTLVKTYPLRLRLDVPETAAGVIRGGTSLSFTTDAFPGETFRAVVRELNPALDMRSRSLSAEARLASNDTRLKPGMFVQVELVVEKNAEIKVVPRQALQTVAGLTKVFTIQSGKIAEHRITPGADRNGWVEIVTDRIQPGDTVAVSELPRLVEGLAVRDSGAKAGRS